MLLMDVQQTWHKPPALTKAYPHLTPAYKLYQRPTYEIAPCYAHLCVACSKECFRTKRSTFGHARKAWALKPTTAIEGMVTTKETKEPHAAVPQEGSIMKTLSLEGSYARVPPEEASDVKPT